MPLTRFAKRSFGVSAFFSRDAGRGVAMPPSVFGSSVSNPIPNGVGGQSMPAPLLLPPPPLRFLGDASLLSLLQCQLSQEL